jgi:WD40-like Beta Propeller Repeat
MKRPAILVTAVLFVLGACGSSPALSPPAGVTPPVSQVPSQAGSAAPSVQTSMPSIVVGSAPSRARNPYGIAANGLLLYDRGGDIFSADPSGTGETALITGPTTDDGPMWSRDGTKFAFVRAVSADHVQLMSADANGSHVRQLSRQRLTGLDWADWSPDGKQLVAHHTIAGHGSISILTDDGRDSLRTLALDKVEPSGFVGWMPPMGRELIFVGHPGVIPSDLGIYAIHPDGTGLRQITLKHHESGDQVSFQDLSLSADGSEAVFWNWEPGVVDYQCCSVHFVDLTTGQDRRMTYESSARSDIRPILSPDGTKIVVESGGDGIPSQLMVAPADASAPGVLIGPTYAYDVEHSFDISPDGSTVVLYMAGEQVRFIDLRTGAITNLSQIMGDPPSWQRRSN